MLFRLGSEQQLVARSATSVSGQTSDARCPPATVDSPKGRIRTASASIAASSRRGVVSRREQDECIQLGQDFRAGSASSTIVTRRTVVRSLAAYVQLANFDSGARGRRVQGKDIRYLFRKGFVSSALFFF